MAGEQYVTRSHDVIRRWAAARDARPSTVAGTRTPDDPGIIRLDFPGRDDTDPLEPIDWDEWFAKLDAAGLVLLYQETTPDGARSSFARLVESDAASSLGDDVEWVDESSRASV